MAYYKFTKAIMNGDPIDVYNNGDMKRDFTYVDDIVAGVVRVMDRVPSLRSIHFQSMRPISFTILATTIR